MSDTSSARDPVEELAEEFAARYRCGEHPSLTEYTDKYPELAEQIRELFPALVIMEQLGSVARPPTEAFEPRAVGRRELPEQLNDYRILREVGRGGMGVVYEAVQESLGRHVALKILPFHRLMDPTHLERFRREARAAAQLHHTNIVPVFGVGEAEGIHYYAMQFIQGLGLDAVLEEVRRLRKSKANLEISEKEPNNDLSDSIVQGLLSGHFQAGACHEFAASAVVASPPNSRGPAKAGHSAGSAPSSTEDSAAVGIAGKQSELASQTEAQYCRSVAQVGAQVAEALAYAHKQGILHRDIKPSNLLLDTRGTVWITDFGLAKAEDSDDLTSPGDIVGTVRFMAPERFQGRAYPASDVYSLGITLYEMLTLRPAFADSHRARLVERVTQEEPPWPRKLDPHIPVDLETIVLKAIAKQSADRYPTADALAEELRRFLKGEPIRARPVSDLERLWRWSKRNPVVASLTAAVFVLLAAVAAVASVGYVREAEQRATAQAAEQEVRGQWYAASINAMQRAWDTGQVDRLRELLAETETYPDRGFEWYYCQRLCHLELRSFIGHRAGVTAVSWSPDGNWLATGNEDGTAKVWDAAGTREPLTFRGHTGQVLCVAWSPDGRLLATASKDQTAKLWDAAAGRDLLTLRGHSSEISSVCWSPDSKQLATASGDKNAMVWDAATGRMLFTLKGHPMPLALLGARTLGLLGSAQAQTPCLASSALYPGTSHSDGLFSVSWSPDGKLLATVSEDGTAKVWNAATGWELSLLDAHTNRVLCLSWSPDGKLMATGSEDGTAKTWDPIRGKEQLTLRAHPSGVWNLNWSRKGHPSGVWSVSWSPDGKRLATGSGDGTAKQWDISNGGERLTLKGHTAEVSSVSWSPDGKWLATGSQDGTAKLWDASSSREVRTFKTFPGGVLSISWSPDGKFLATGNTDGTAKVLEAATGRELFPLKDLPSGAMSFSWTPDGSSLATGNYDGSAMVWDATSGRQLRTLPGNGGWLWSVDWSPDGHRLATGSRDGITVWDTASGATLLALKRHTGPVHSVCWSPDGTWLATGSEDGTAKVWEAASGRELHTFQGHTDGLACVSWSPDGKRLATGSGDGTVKVWEAPCGRELLSLKGHPGGARCIAWSPDGKRLATGSGNGNVKVWETARGRELLSLKGQPSPVRSVFWSPVGDWLAAGSVDGTVKVWEAAAAETVQAWGRQDCAWKEYLALNAVRGPHAQGFIQTWLLLLPPFSFAPGEILQALDGQQVPGEARLSPRRGERVRIGDNEWVWQEFRSPQAILDFNAVLGQVKERSAAYAACYLASDRPRNDLWLQVGSDDQSKVYLNGREVYVCRSGRPLDGLDTIGPVVLKQGPNVLLFKVLNGNGNWQGCLRLVDAAGRPAAGIHVQRAPEP
jgi:WD40 repeat protein/serine/threonine protein kinase